MKTKELPENMYDFHGTLIDTTQDVSYTTELNGKPFTVNGPFATIIEQAEAEWAAADKYEAAARKAAVVEAPRKMARVALGAVEPLAEGLKTEVRVSLYDFMNGTNFKRELRRQRQLRRDTEFARSLGILSVEPCAKHRRAMDAVRAIR